MREIAPGVWVPESEPQPDIVIEDKPLEFGITCPEGMVMFVTAIVTDGCRQEFRPDLPLHPGESITIRKSGKVEFFWEERYQR
jgi:hypothetical protein